MAARALSVAMVGPDIAETPSSSRPVVPEPPTGQSFEVPETPTVVPVYTSEPPTVPTGAVSESPSMSSPVVPEPPKASLVSPRLVSGGLSRTKIACSLCALSKTKCDFQRPCRRCIRRGTESLCVDRKSIVPCEDGTWIFAEEQKFFRKRNPLACMACFQSKIKCTGERPCTRCLRSGRECIERVPKRKVKGNKDQDSTGEHTENADFGNVSGKEVEEMASSFIAREIVKRAKAENLNAQETSLLEWNSPQEAVAELFPMSPQEQTSHKVVHQGELENTEINNDGNT